MTEKTPPLGSEPFSYSELHTEMEPHGDTPPPSEPFDDSAFLDLDDPHITGRLLSDTSAEFHLDAAFPSPPPPPQDDEESSFAQLWAATLTDAQPAYQPQAPDDTQHPPAAADHFAAWQEAAERHHLPAAVALLPPPVALAQQEDEEEDYAAQTPGFFSTQDAPLFFVDEQWSPEAFLQAELVSQNPFEESVAVLSELSFQYAPQDAAHVNLIIPSDGAQSFFPSANLLPHEESSESTQYFTHELSALHPADTMPPDEPAPFFDGAPPWSPIPELQTGLWLFHPTDEEPEEDIILLDDELPSEDDDARRPPTPPYGLAAAQPPKIPPLFSPAPTPEPLSPAIFYDAPLTAASPLTPDSPALLIHGRHDVVLYMLNGNVKRGAFQNVDLTQSNVPLETPEDIEQINVEHIKAVYVLKNPELHPPPPSSFERWKVVFNDGRRVDGQLAHTPENAQGFFLIPKQECSPTAYLYINRSAVLEISSLPV